MEVWEKSLELRFILQPMRRVMEFEDRVMALGSLSVFVAVIVERRACCSWWEDFGCVFLVYSSS